MFHPRPWCDGWRKAAHARASLHADVYEWQVAGLLATAKLDAAAKARIMAVLGPSTPQPDVTTDGSSGGVASSRCRTLSDSWPTTSTCPGGTRSLHGWRRLANRPRPLHGSTPTAIALRRSPAQPVGRARPGGHGLRALRIEYERRRADATAAGFALLAALRPELVRAELADDR